MDKLLKQLENLPDDKKRRIAAIVATHESAPKCPTCNDHGMVGGPSYYAPDEGGEPCPDCSAPKPEGE